MARQRAHQLRAALWRPVSRRLDPWGHRDQLTGLANRHALMAHLQAAVRHGGAVCVLYVDLDDFKLVNDTLGHSAGDELLRHVASAMNGLVTLGDVLARQGGDEFVLVATDVPDEHELARRLRDAITQPVLLRGLNISVGASIGVASCPRDGTDPTLLIETADVAMYEAKHTGRNQIRAGARPSPRGRELDRAALEFTTALPAAIEQDELILHWQPLVDLGDLSIVGLEALVRWNHPTRGLLLPGAFLPFAEATGLISAVDTWVAGAVTRQRLRWQAQGLDPYVGFNLTPSFARRPGALDMLLRQCSGDGLGFDHLTVELTESEALREDHHLNAFVRGLHEAGVTVGLDDFGQAYSSLNRLREVPARWVKLDRAFLQGVPDDQVATDVLVAILELLRALRFDVIVEGVEQEAQRQTLRGFGVRVAQGFLLGRPVPADELYDRLLLSPPSQLAVEIAATATPARTVARADSPRSAGESPTIP